MEIRQVMLDQDLPTLNEWYQGHNLSYHPKNWFGSIGYMVPNIAAAFLYLTSNSERAYIDDLISNPAFSDINKRSEAIHLIGLKLEEEAQKHHIKYLCSCTTKNSILKHLETLGWRSDNKDYKMMMKIMENK